MTAFYLTLSVADLTSEYNTRFGKSVKPGSYPKAKMIEALNKFDQDRADAALQTSDTPAITFEETPGGVGYPAPAPTTKEEKGEEEEKGETLEGSCPLCKGAPENQTAAGSEGTFLGDSCNLCHECGKTYNAFTGVEVPSQGVNKKRRILNPQGKIDAKEEALRASSFSLTYDRNSRIWTIASTLESDQPLVWNMSSKQFSEFGPTEIVATAVANLRQN